LTLTMPTACKEKAQQLASFYLWGLSIL
jgi:hypothetical protein